MLRRVLQLSCTFSRRRRRAAVVGGSCVDLQRECLLLHAGIAPKKFGDKLAEVGAGPSARRYLRSHTLDATARQYTRAQHIAYNTRR